MFCYKCGCALPDDSVFCQKCGSCLVNEGITQQDAIQNNTQASYNMERPSHIDPPQQYMRRTANHKKPIYKNVWAWVIAAVVIIALIIIVIPGDDPSNSPVMSGRPVIPESDIESNSINGLIMFNAPEFAGALSEIPDLLAFFTDGAEVTSSETTTLLGLSTIWGTKGIEIIYSEKVINNESRADMNKVGEYVELLESLGWERNLVLFGWELVKGELKIQIGGLTVGGTMITVISSNDFIGTFRTSIHDPKPTAEAIIQLYEGLTNQEVNELVLEWTDGAKTILFSNYNAVDNRIYWGVINDSVYWGTITENGNAQEVFPTFAINYGRLEIDFPETSIRPLHLYDGGLGNDTATSVFSWSYQARHSVNQHSQPGTESPADISLQTVYALEGWVSVDIPSTWHIFDMNDEGYTFSEIHNDDFTISLTISDMAGGLDWRFENSIRQEHITFYDWSSGYMFFYDNNVVEWVHENLGVVITLHDYEDFYIFNNNKMLLNMIADSLTFA